MKPTLLAFLVLALFACGGVEVVQPKPSTVSMTGTDTGTETATSSAPATAIDTTATATASAATPTVVVNNNIDNTQNNGGAPATAAATSTASAHPGQIAKGDTEAEVQAVLGTPMSVMMCNSDATGWWYNGYCVGFENGVVASQYEVPAVKLYLPSW